MGKTRSRVRTVPGNQLPASVKYSLHCLGPVPIVMSHLSPEEWESLVDDTHEAASAGHDAVASGGVAPASRPPRQ